MRYLLPISILLFLVACPKPVEELDPAICDEGYYPCGPDSQECCPDTTSHDFTWTTEEIGIYGSYLNDVSIIDENNIWAVGLIIMPDPDSSDNGSGEERFNAIHWDGFQWNLVKAMRPEAQYVTELKSVFALSENDVWFGRGGFPLHWNGTEFYLYSTQTGEHPGQPSINAIWGPTASDLYFVGYAGSIFHYDGNIFSMLHSGTSVNLIDIAGSPDGEHVFATAVVDSDVFISVVIELRNGVWEQLYRVDHLYPEPGDLGGAIDVSVLSDTAYIATMAGLWKYNFLDSSSTTIPRSQTGVGYGELPHEIETIGSNNISIVDASWNFVHFNGASWKLNKSVNQFYGNRNVWASAADMQGRILVIAGYRESPQSSLVMIGKYGN